MNKQRFQYQIWWLRWIWCLPFVFFLILVHRLLDYIIFDDVLYYMIGILIILLGIDIFFSRTIGNRFYLKNGSYWIDDNKIHIQINKKTYILNDINEIFICQKRLLSSKFVLLQIKTDSHKLKLYSKFLQNNETMKDSDLMNLFYFIQKRTSYLKKEKDITGTESDFWYKKK